MPTNLVRDTVTEGWRDGWYRLIYNGQRAGIRADDKHGGEYYELLELERECYAAAALVDQAISQHNDAFYGARLGAWYSEHLLLSEDECTCMSRENEPLCPVCEREAANRSEPF